MVKSTTPKPAKTTKNQSEAMKKYRQDLSILKKKGLIDPDYDVRHAEPTRYMKEKIKHFSDVINGKASVFKVEPADYKRLIKAGEKGANNRIVLPKGDRYVKGQIVTPESKNTKKSSKKGKKGQKGPEEGQTVEEFLMSEIEFPTLQPGEVYSFTFLGNQSRFSSRDPRELLKMLMNYPDVKEAFQKRDIASERAAIAAFEVISGDPKVWAETQKGRQSSKVRWNPSGVPLSEQIKNVGKANATGRTQGAKERKTGFYAEAKARQRASKSEEQKAEINAKRRAAYQAKKERENA